MELKFSENENAEQVAIDINFFSNLENAKENLTEEIVFSHFKASARIKLQDICRKLSAKGTSLKDIQVFINENLNKLLIKSGRIKKSDYVHGINGKIADLTMRAAIAQNFDIINKLNNISQTTDTSSTLEVLKTNWDNILTIEKTLTDTETDTE